MENYRSENCKIGGIIVPLVTPLRSDGTLDLRSLERIVAHVVEGGVDGLFVLGSTAEAASLSIETRISVLRSIAKAAPATVPVIANVSDTAMEHTLQLAEQAASVGAFGVALSPPSYFPLDQQQLRAYVEHFCERSPLPVFLYNIPQFAHTSFAPETVCNLAELRNVIGLKNSDGSLDYLRKVQTGLRRRDNFSLLVGNEETLLPALRIGADGGVCGGANMFPQIFVDLFKAATQDREADAERLQNIVVRVSEAIYQVGAPETSYLRGLKRALARLQLIEDVLAEPLQNFHPAEKAELDAGLAEIREAFTELAAINYSAKM